MNEVTHAYLSPAWTIVFLFFLLSVFYNLVITDLKALKFLPCGEFMLGEGIKNNSTKKLRAMSTNEFRVSLTHVGTRIQLSLRSRECVCNSKFFACSFSGLMNPAFVS